MSNQTGKRMMYHEAVIASRENCPKCGSCQYPGATFIPRFVGESDPRLMWVCKCGYTFDSETADATS